MNTVIFLGKRNKPGSPLVDYPGAHLAGTTHSNQKWGKRYGTVDDWHSWWDLHPFDPVPGYTGIIRRRRSTYEWYKTLPGVGEPGHRPLYLTELRPEIPAGVLFPKEEICDAFARKVHGRWFTCQVDLMMAWFILKGVHHIILHGHGQRFDRKHMIDHCGVLVWMTVARERGIKVTILKPSWYLGPDRAYGIDYAGDWGFRATG